jgi:hypothetical protein
MQRGTCLQIVILHGGVRESQPRYSESQIAIRRLLHLLFGVLRIFGTLIELNRKRSHDCSDCPNSKAGAARTVM